MKRNRISVFDQKHSDDAREWHFPVLFVIGCGKGGLKIGSCNTSLYSWRAWRLQKQQTEKKSGES
jgi:hypothetical protein